MHLLSGVADRGYQCKINSVFGMVVGRTANRAQNFVTLRSKRGKLVPGCQRLAFLPRPRVQEQSLEIGDH